MKKTEYEHSINTIKNMSKKFTSLNESINFDDEGYDEYSQEGMPQEEGGMEEEPVDEFGEDAQEHTDFPEVDQIREIALKGMIKLCKNPEDEHYQALKKIFQFCDKAVEPKDDINKK